jgi:hypothetical protein
MPVIPPLVFDGSSPSAPCFFVPPPPEPIEEPQIDPSAIDSIPDNTLLAPTEIPGNDLHAIQITKTLAKLPPAKPPMTPGTCTVQPTGFVCGPLPALPGSIVKCVPRLDHSNLNQLAARVMPLTVSRSSGYMSNPSLPDPRFAIYPSKFPPAFSRCCAGKLTNPLDITPPTCDAKSAVYEHIIPNPKAHEIHPMGLGFQRSDLEPQRHQQAITSKFLNSVNRRGPNDGSTMNGRLALWENEARRIPMSALEKIKMMSMPMVFFPPQSYRGELIENFL